MPARIDDDLLSTSTRVIIGGWWPSTAVHLAEVEAFLRQGTMTQTLAEDVHSLYQSLSIGSVQHLAGPIPSLLAITTNGVEVWYSADGLYVCSIVQDSISRGHDILQAFVEQQWLPALKVLCRQDGPLSQLSPLQIGQPTIVQITTAQPLLFEIAATFGAIINYVNEPDIVIQSSADYLFIITSAEAQEDGWWLSQWWIFMAAFQAEQSQSLVAHRRLWQNLDLVELRRAMPMVKAPGLRAKLLHWQIEVDTHIYRLEQLLDYIDLRLTTVETITASQALPQSPQAWAIEARQSHDYLLSGWSMAAQRLGHWQASLHSIEDQARNFNVTLLRAIVTLLMTGLFLNWLHNLVLPEVSLTWFAATIILLVVSLTLHLIINMIYRHQRYRILDNRPLLPRAKRAR